MDPSALIYSILRSSWIRLEQVFVRIHSQLDPIP